MKPGEYFEKTVHTIEEALKNHPSTKVEHDTSLVDSTGATRQIDILIETEINKKIVRVIIECKDTARPTSVKDMEAFVTKTNKLPVHKKVYVSRSGYQSGALTTAIASNIELYTLSTLNDKTIKTWLLKSNIAIVKHQFTFDQALMILDVEETKELSVQNIKWTDQKYYRHDLKTEVTLQNIQDKLVGYLIQQIKEQKLAVLSHYNIQFDFPNPLFYIKINKNFIGIYGIRAQIRRTEETETHELTELQSYTNLDNNAPIAITSSKQISIGERVFDVRIVDTLDRKMRVTVTKKK